MSFSNTKTPLKPSDGKGRKYLTATEGNRICLSEEQKADFIRLYPKTLNTRMMVLFGMSHGTLHRFARMFGLKKDMAVIRRKQAALTKRICEKNGYYDSIRGKRPSDACVEATKRMFAEGFSPMKALKEKNPRKYRAALKKKSESRKELIEREKRRERYGLGQKTNLPYQYTCDFRPFTSRESAARLSGRKRGYTFGNPDPRKCERYVMFFDEQTERSAIFERNCEKLGFRIVEIRQIADTGFSE